MELKFPPQLPPPPARPTRPAELNGASVARAEDGVVKLWLVLDGRIVEIVASRFVSAELAATIARALVEEKPRG